MGGFRKGGMADREGAEYGGDESIKAGGVPGAGGTCQAGVTAAESITFPHSDFLWALQVGPLDDELLTVRVKQWGPAFITL